MRGLLGKCLTGMVGTLLAAGAAWGADEVKLGPPGAPVAPAVAHITYSGNTVFRNSSLDEIALPLLTNRLADLQALEKVRVAITRKYVDAGYINSGAVIPSQDIGGGDLRIDVVEGMLSGVKVSGNKWTKDHIIANRVARGADLPLNVNRLRENLELLRMNYPIAQANSRLDPGDKPGTATLDLKVVESPVLRSGLRFRNDLPPSSGANQVDFLLQSPNLLGYFDDFDFDFGLYRFGQGESRFLEGDNFSLSYRIPISAGDTKVGGFYRRSTASVQEEPFNVLGIRSDTEAYGLTLDHPFINSLTRQFGMGLTFEHRISRTFLFGQPFSFSPGPINGESTVTAVRWATYFTDRGDRHVFSARLTTSVGVDLWDATRQSGGERDGRFVSVLGQMQYLRRLFDTRSVVVARLTGQWASEGLLPNEQFAVGGANTVRGYRENTLVRDTGIASTLEVRIPVFAEPKRREWLTLAPFFEVGAGWNLRGGTPSPTEISSIGIGLHSTPFKGLSASLSWGYALQDVSKNSGDLQDAGLHFNLTWWAF